MGYYYKIIQIKDWNIVVAVVVIIAVVALEVVLVVRVTHSTKLDKLFAQTNHQRHLSYGAIISPAAG